MEKPDYTRVTLKIEKTRRDEIYQRVIDLGIDPAYFNNVAYMMGVKILFRQFNPDENIPTGVWEMIADRYMDQLDPEKVKEFFDNAE